MHSSKAKDGLALLMPSRLQPGVDFLKWTLNIGARIRRSRVGKAVGTDRRLIRGRSVRDGGSGCKENLRVEGLGSSCSTVERIRFGQVALSGTCWTRSGAARP